MHSVIRNSPWFTAVALCFMVVPSPAAEQHARTEDGKVVILRDDGTWVYADGTPVKPGKAGKPSATDKPLGQKPKETNFKKNSQAKFQYKSRRGVFDLWLVPDVWIKVAKKQNPATEIEFHHKDNECFAYVIAERIDIPMNRFKDIVTENLNKAADKYKLVNEEKRVVNGSDVVLLEIDATVQGLPFSYLIYLSTSDAGCIQVMSFTHSKLLKEYRPDMEAFLNGFVLRKPDDE